MTLVPPASAPSSGTGDGLTYDVAYRPAYALAQIGLAPGTVLRAEAGAMVTMAGPIDLDARMEGGLFGAVKRGVTGRSAFVSTYTAQGPGARVELAPATPGDIVPIRVDGESICIASSGYLASSPGLQVDTGWGGGAGFFAVDGLFIIRTSGAGVLFVCSYGALHEHAIAAGEKFVVDTGHLVAWPASMPYEVRRATQRGLFRSVASGEALVAELTGPGTVYVQTRNISAFAALLGGGNDGGNRGPLQGLLGSE